MKIVVTGGHHNSALVVAKELLNRGNKIYWFGHKFTMLGDDVVSAEYQEVCQAGIPFYSIVAGKLQIQQHFLQHLARIPVGFVQSFILLVRIKPDLIYASGGYIALPVCLIGWLFRIPVFTHEQSVVGGLANRLIAYIAKRIYTAFPANYPYSASKTLFVGLPIREELNTRKKKIFTNQRKTIYITGGKQGSHPINEAVFGILPDVLKEYNVIHQCGSNSIYSDYGKSILLQKKLGNLAKYYVIQQYFTIHEIGNVFHSADLIIGRAGAHTVYEMLYLNKPGLLIPIPWTHNDEQTRNAQFFVDCGLGRILSQDKLNSKTLRDEIKFMLTKLDKFTRNNNFIPPTNTTELIIKDMYGQLRHVV